MEARCLFLTSLLKGYKMLSKKIHYCRFQTSDITRIHSILTQFTNVFAKRQSHDVPVEPHFDLQTRDAAPVSLSHPQFPIILQKIEYPNRYASPKQAWIESLKSLDDEKLGTIDLHPDIFGTYPRIDILHRNIVWQNTYKKIHYEKTKSRAEVRGGGRKPWPQKGLGRARHGSIRSPIWVGGGRAMGPRGPQSYFYMLPRHMRVLGLRTALSCKYAQNDLHIVDSLEIPSDDPAFMEDLLDTRFWGFSALFVDDTDIMPKNISLALSKIPHFNLMPTYGLNVYSMLKHETLILTLAAVEKIQEKLLHQMHKTALDKSFKNERLRY